MKSEISWKFLSGVLAVALIVLGICWHENSIPEINKKAGNPIDSIKNANMLAWKKTYKTIDCSYLERTFRNYGLAYLYQKTIKDNNAFLFINGTIIDMSVIGDEYTLVITQEKKTIQPSKYVRNITAYLSISKYEADSLCNLIATKHVLLKGYFIADVDNATIDNGDMHYLGSLISFYLN